MTFTGFNFRQTLAYVTDGPNDVWAGLTASSYKSVADGGTGYGWLGSAPTGGNSSNVSTSYDARLAGRSGLATGYQYRIDVPNGVYDIRFALVGNVTLTRYYPKVKVGAGTTEGVDQFTLDTGSANANNTHIPDASGNVWAPADWPANNVPLRVTVTQGFFIITQGSAPSGVSHFAYQEVVTPLEDGVLHDEVDAAVTPKLMEAQPADKVLGYLSFTVGSDVDIDYSITQADGVTEDPYLTLRTVNGKRAICYKDVRFPGTDPDYTFYITQTDKVPGKHANAPYIQEITLDVVAAPDKPHGDGSILAKASTGAYLLRKKVIDQLSAPYTGTNPVTDGLWPGYQGQEFYQTTTCYTTASVISTITSMKANAGSGRWFCVEIDQDGTSDWGTASIAANGNASGDWLFKPEEGGGLLIRYKQDGAKPMLKGVIYPRCPRGVQIDGLTIASDNSVGSAAAGIRCDNGVGAGGELAIWKISNNNLGFLHDPAYAGTTPDTVDEDNATAGLLIFGYHEQLIITGNKVYGATDAFQVVARQLLIEDNDVAYVLGDVHAMAQPNPAQTGAPDADQYLLIRNNTNRSQSSASLSYHSDWYQQRTHNYHGTGTCYIWGEENFVHKSADINFGGGSINQISDDATLQSGFLNNIFASDNTHGMELAYGADGIGYAEYNSFGMSSKFVANDSNYGRLGIYGGSGGAKIRDRKNILTFSNDMKEDETIYSGKISDAKDPNDVMNGPFIEDPTYPSMPRYIAQIEDDPLQGVTAAQFKAAMIAAFSPKSGIDAGYQAPSSGPVSSAHRNLLTMGIG